MTEQYIRRPNTCCRVCGKKLYRRPIELQRSNGNAYCSNECYGKSCRKEAPCLVCGKPILAGLHKKTCSRGCANTHRKGIKYKLNRPKDKVKAQGLLKLRLLKTRGRECERCGFKKYEILQLHHKNKDRNNNDLDNLEILCPNCHSEEHYLDKSWVKSHYNIKR